MKIALKRFAHAMKRVFRPQLGNAQIFYIHCRINGKHKVILNRQ